MHRTYVYTLKYYHPVIADRGALALGGRHRDGFADVAVARVVRGRTGQPGRRRALRGRHQLQILGHKKNSCLGRTRGATSAVSSTTTTSRDTYVNVRVYYV